MKPRDAIRELGRHIQTGRNVSSKLKIVQICFLKYAEGRSPIAIKKVIDLFVNGMLIETNVKFFIRTLNDFFIFSSLWEKELQNAFKFKKGMNFLDVGAHIGKYTLRASLKIGEEGKVIAVEPDKECHIDCPVLRLYQRHRNKWNCASFRCICVNDRR